MSVCDEGWGDFLTCPCLISRGCSMGVFERNHYDDGTEVGEAIERTDSINCPYASILKLLLEAVEVSSEEKMKTTKHVFGEMAIQDLKAKGWERVEFWIRRKS